MQWACSAALDRPPAPRIAGLFQFLSLRCGGKWTQDDDRCRSASPQSVQRHRSRRCVTCAASNAASHEGAWSNGGRTVANARNLVATPAATAIQRVLPKLSSKALKAERLFAPANR